MKTGLRIMALIVLIQLMPSVTQAQQDVQDDRSVMILPFDPNMYFSDADDKLAKYNDKSIKEVQTLFRYGLNINVNAKILSQYQTRPLLTDTARGAVEDLYAIYKGISYFKDKSNPAPKTEQNAYASGEKKKFFNLKKSGESAGQKASSVEAPDRVHEYMNVKIHDSRMLPFLKDKYGTSIFVFLNQFDLVTNYEHCLDRATNTFERDIKVHFSIFDYNGKQLAGDVAVVHFPSNSNDITEIMRNNFPAIADYLAKELPIATSSPRESPQKISSGKELEYMQLEKSE